MSVHLEQHDHESHNSDQFDPYRLFDAISKCLYNKESGREHSINVDSVTAKSAEIDLSEFNDVLLKNYLIAYDEIAKFLHCLGSVFYFVTSDIYEKIKLLNGYLKDSPAEYRTFATLFKHEHDAGLLQKPASSHRKNATRNILRLHRALIFIHDFLEKLNESDKHAKTAHVCAEVYDNTLAKYHPWVVRKAAKLGMHAALPRREQLIDLMIKRPEDQDDQAKFKLFLRTLRQVYDLTQALFVKYDLLELP